MGTEPQLFKTRRAWRTWLARNHDKKNEIWLAYYKKGAGRKSVSYEEALEEALCFGWIDSTVNRLDEERYQQRYTPRSKKSVWSAANKRRVEKLIAEGRMAPPGLAKVRAAKRNGSWERLDEIDRIGRGSEAPADLLEALDGTSNARELFDRRPLSEKKLWAYWVLSAKRSETRARRIAETVRRIVAGRRPGT